MQEITAHQRIKTAGRKGPGVVFKVATDARHPRVVLLDQGQRLIVAIGSDHPCAALEQRGQVSTGATRKIQYPGIDSNQFGPASHPGRRPGNHKCVSFLCSFGHQMLQKEGSEARV